MQSTDKTKIVIAGRDFEIPCLPFKKNRVIVQACCFAIKAMNDYNGPDKVPLSITAIDYMYLAVYEAVSFVDPKISREDFDKWQIYMPDLAVAVTQIATQTGVLVRAEGGGSGEKKT